MNQKTVILTVVLFALIVVGMFTFARLRHFEVTSISMSKIIPA